MCACVVQLTADLVESCYTPIIQSGGVYDLKPSAVSNDDQLHFGTIICSLGARYRHYCSNVARTYFVDPDKVRSPPLHFFSFRVHCPCVDADD